MPAPVSHVIIMVVAHRLVRLFSVLARVPIQHLNVQVQARVRSSIDERLLSRQELSRNTMFIIALSKWRSVCQSICERIVEIVVLSVAIMLAILFNVNVHPVFKELPAKHQPQVSHLRLFVKNAKYCLQVFALIIIV